MKGIWIRRPSDGLAVVFLHGVLSSGETCWTASSGAYWPSLLADEATLARVGVYVFSYETGLFSGSYRLGDIVDTLKELMRLDGLFDCRGDRKSTRLNSSHVKISYAVFCLKKNNTTY